VKLNKQPSNEVAPDDGDEGEPNSDLGESIPRERHPVGWQDEDIREHADSESYRYVDEGFEEGVTAVLGGHSSSRLFLK
jgi:hypothetical protein